MDISPETSKGPSGSETGSTEFVAQKLLAPNPKINSEVDLFYHIDGQAGYDTQQGSYYCFKESTIVFDSFFNAFPLHCYDLGPKHKLKIRIRIQGKGVVRLYLARNESSWEQLIHTLLDHKECETVEFELPKLGDSGLVFLQVYAKTEVKIVSADYIIEGPVLNDATVTGVITTFKRDAAVQDTCDRLETYFSENKDIADLFQLLVVDNGGDTDEVGFSRGRVIKNKNYGGAGGFSRGLLEVMEGDLSSHVLFMDDDATIFPESLRRTLAALRYSSDPKRAISGAMITEKHKWMMWDNSALFNRRCIPLHCRVDLRDFTKVLFCAFDNLRTQDNRYGGWWYFCFPVDQIKTWAFPFFVRGDDIYFSLANDFHIRTMPGVVSMQEDFAVKQSPQSIYMDTRNHLVQHLTFSFLRSSFWGDFWMLWRLFNRYNSAYHYDSAEAILVAIEDVIKGRDFWTNDMDMSKKRAQIKALTKNEAFSEKLEYGAVHLTPAGVGRFRKAYLFRVLTLGGHILPNFLFFSNGRRMPLNLRAEVTETFLRPVVVTMDSSEKTGYVCRIDRPRYFKNLRHFIKTITTFAKERNRLVREYEEMKEKKLNKAFWKSVLLED